jgi:hypothetical protein
VKTLIKKHFDTPGQTPAPPSDARPQIDVSEIIIASPERIDALRETKEAARGAREGLQGMQRAKHVSAPKMKAAREVTARGRAKPKRRQTARSPATAKRKTQRTNAVARKRQSTKRR